MRSNNDIFLDLISSGSESLKLFIEKSITLSSRINDDLTGSERVAELADTFSEKEIALLTGIFQVQFRRLSFEKIQNENFESLYDKYFHLFTSNNKLDFIISSGSAYDDFAYTIPPLDDTHEVYVDPDKQESILQDPISQESPINPDTLNKTITETDLTNDITTNLPVVEKKPDTDIAYTNIIRITQSFDNETLINALLSDEDFELL